MIRPNTSHEIEEYFTDGGPLDREFSSFERRDEQTQMSCSVYEAMKSHRHLAVEAGTGVGKSYAYLIPAIHSLAEHGGKVLISTFTITLQEQLIHKDIPALAKAMPQQFTASLAKGRSNYLCLRRLNYALGHSRNMFSQIGDEIEHINRWSVETKDGSLSDMPFVPSSQAWDTVRSEHGNCPDRMCQHFKDCFYRRARRKLDTSDIIIANHALMFSDLVLKEQGHSLLPKYQYVIIDEAHNIETVAQNHFGIDLSNRRISYLLDKLYNSRTKRGLLSFHPNTDKALELVSAVRSASNKFFKNVRNWYEQNERETNGRCYANFVEDNLTGHLKLLRSQLSGMANKTEGVDEKYEIIRYANLAAELIMDIGNFLSQEFKDQVYWIELGMKKMTTVRLKSAPLNVGNDVKRALFDIYDSVILTSATLSADGSEKAGFNFFAGRIGLEDFIAKKLGSPFDYEKHVTLYIEKDLPAPNDFAFIKTASAAICKYIELTAGRAFVLFTSYDMLNKVTQATGKWFADNDIELLVQGNRVDRTTLLKKFRKGQRCALFGTDSFWQGVDVPGETLSNVIIAKLPFAVPNQPLVAGRLEQIKENGGNPFFDYQLPSAIIKFKQGFGRLIRSKTDHGIVVVLDNRIINKRYGQQFLSAIPKCKVEIVSTNA